MTRQQELWAACALEAAEAAVRVRGAAIVPVVAAAMACLESRYGQSELAKMACNLLGIKAGRTWRGATITMPTREWVREKTQDGVTVPGHWIRVQAAWRCYPSMAACFDDFGAIVNRLPWYSDAKAAALRDDAEGFLAGLQFDPHGPGPADDEPGWFTDPKYVEKVRPIMAAIRGLA